LGQGVESTEEVGGERDERVAEDLLEDDDGQHQATGEDEAQDVGRRTLDVPA
jgi:hypothetical protein